MIKKINIRNFPTDAKPTTGDKILILDKETNNAKWIPVESMRGDTGASIERMEMLHQTKGLLTLRVYLSDGTHTDMEVQMPVGEKGEKGEGIKEIRSREYLDHVVIQFELESGQIENVRIPK